MKIYTKTGDTGTTALFGGDRVPKHHIRIESYGTVDELNSWIGLLRDQDIDRETKDILIEVQNKLFTIGAILATPPEKATLKSGKDRLNIERISNEDITFLEKAIDKMDAELPVMTHFILPGGHPIVSYCHLARTVCRRAERRATHLYENEPFEEVVIRYLNRLSDFLFVLARKLTLAHNAEEVAWIPEKKS
ncbi:cob(I)yrinic acid a,c-diamide adenosyltransferase [Robertkochia marina]|uniref:Corrinoid adenosyltransferase n=1 Tax=Robertkochia marina TaxID=1227945 RepID=A0A4S3LX82_9FLAO|nr:cob(I)yrinic acid a,c-diamide adenosyltransferase [Robertkochia marina]THD65788.1 cob(I)yrinic acid a,c-diamide adenosyltransferase [Robertkochia marina]TRZ46527.1 cob(I)yrinic acid a,c-diamide adenosyltransferase [Robertkochia marina]